MTKKTSRLVLLEGPHFGEQKTGQMDNCILTRAGGDNWFTRTIIHADSTFIAHRSRAHFCFMKFIPINVLVPCDCCVETALTAGPYPEGAHMG